MTPQQATRRLWSMGVLAMVTVIVVAVVYHDWLFAVWLIASVVFLTGYAWFLKGQIGQDGQEEP